MSTKKKPIAKAEDKAEYKVGDSAYFVDYGNSKPRIFMGKISEIISTTQATRDSVTDKITGTYTGHVYVMKTAIGIVEVKEYKMHKTFPSAAIALGKQYFVGL